MNTVPAEQPFHAHTFAPWVCVLRKVVVMCVCVCMCAEVPSTPPPAGAPKSPTGSGRATPSVDLMAASNARIAALQRQLSERDEQLRVLQQQVGDGKVSTVLYTHTHTHTRTHAGVLTPTHMRRHNTQAQSIGTNIRGCVCVCVRVCVCMQIAVQQREAEISRLGLRAGGDAEVVALTARNKANEDMILQLNRTVRHMQLRT